MRFEGLQIITVVLENGETGMFIGRPLVPEEYSDEDCQVEQVWFSNIQELPVEMTLGQLMRMVQQQLCRCRSTVQ
ncbi:hypothetical protein QVG61_00840 [Thiohalobacter sp. IOR34]|uniref:hypothetical protein n=1 Tax=Thiohalobacter sp. IOR34 TaxID=3057176 RepID=UPI0025AF95A7|nr:hypothetical protein [Thiohalobacter sp. IOR34]WJW75665.1 hypothetical protein QVG61_00840 [Thiohalobacter sp. IOR34]